MDLDPFLDRFRPLRILHADISKTTSLFTKSSPFIFTASYQRLRVKCGKRCVTLNLWDVAKNQVENCLLMELLREVHLPTPSDHIVGKICSGFLQNHWDLSLPAAFSFYRASQTLHLRAPSWQRAALPLPGWPPLLLSSRVPCGGNSQRQIRKTGLCCTASSL